MQDAEHGKQDPGAIVRGRKTICGVVVFFNDLLGFFFLFLLFSLRRLAHIRGKDFKLVRVCVCV